MIDIKLFQTILIAFMIYTMAAAVVTDWDNRYEKRKVFGNVITILGMSVVWAASGGLT